MSIDLILIAVSLFTWGLGESAFLNFQPLYLQQLGAKPILIGSLLSVYGLIAGFTHLPAGYLADRFGRRIVMWVAWVLGLVATIMMAFARELPGFIAGMMLYGSTLFVLAPLNSYVTAAKGNLSVGRVITIISATFNMGAVIGPTMGGWIGVTYGHRTIFVIAAVLFSISTGIIFFIRPQPVESVDGEEARVGKLFANTRFLGFSGILFFIAFAMFLPTPLAPNFLQNEKGLDLVRIGWLYTIGGIGIVALNLILGWFESRIGFLLGQLAVAIFAFSLWQGTGFVWFALGYFLFGGFRTTRLLALAQVQEMIDPANMGLAYGVSETVISLATFLAPILAGYLYATQPVSIFSLSVILILGGMLISGVYVYTRRPAWDERVAA